MLSIKEELNRIFGLDESLDDKFIFKAIYLGGPPGSGKGYISNEIYKRLQGQIKIVDTDHVFEYMLKKENLPLQLEPSETQLGTKQQIVRAKSDIMNTNRLKNYLNGFLPLIIDGTSKNTNNLIMLKDKLIDNGYDVLFFLNFCPLEVSLQGDENRKKEGKRSVGPHIVKSIWDAVNRNKEAKIYEKIFGPENTIVFEKKSMIPNAQEQKILDIGINKLVKFVQSPVKNPIGQKIINSIKGSSNG